MTEESSEEMTEESSEEMTEESSEEMTDESGTSAEEPETDAIVAAFDANGDGTVTIGVAAAGPRDDNGYYQSLVNFAEEFSADNGFAPPIVSDNIGPAEAAQSSVRPRTAGCRHLDGRRQRDRRTAARSDRAVPRDLLVLQLRRRIPGAARVWPRPPTGARRSTTPPASRWVRSCKSRAAPTPVFLGCCDINFEVEAYEATRVRARSPSTRASRWSTSAPATSSSTSTTRRMPLPRSPTRRRTVRRSPTPTSGGALDPVGQLGSDEGMAVFAAGPADVCDREIPWTGGVVFDGGVYASQALRLIIAGRADRGLDLSVPDRAGPQRCGAVRRVRRGAGSRRRSVRLLASFDETLYNDLGAISGAAYGG